MRLATVILLNLAALAYGHGFEEFVMATTQPPQHTCSPPTDTVCPSTCVLPDCKCSGTETHVPVKSDRPQIVYLTYDDALTEYAHSNFYKELFEDTSPYVNPDDCPIRATHFLTAQYTDYSLVHYYWSRGHEMASHSITHRSDVNYWAGMNIDTWADEMNGMRSMAAQFANIPFEHITGTRAPFLQMGGDEMYEMLSKYNFTYDCSWTTREYGYMNLDAGLYPYTMDYRSVQECQIEPCPRCSLPGLWVQPMLNLEDDWDLGEGHGQPCSMLDGCIIMENPTAQTVKDMLMKNFERVYNGNRAPFGLYMHAGWFFGDNVWHFEGYKLFLSEILKNEDVWIVTIQEGLDYIRNYDNYTNAEIKDLAANGEGPFSCEKLFTDPIYTQRNCGSGNSCRFPNVTNADIPGQERYMKICNNKWENDQNMRQNCPDPSRYPWLGDHCGGNTPCQSEISF